MNIQHNNLIQGILEGLRAIFFECRHADKVVRHLLRKNRLWGRRDRAQVASVIYDIVRWKRFVEFMAGIEHLTEENIHLLLRYWLERKAQVPTFSERASLPRAIALSIPDVLDNLGMKELKTRWPLEMEALNQKADTIIRVNTLKTDRKSLQERLFGEGIITEVLQGHPEALLIEGRKNLIGAKSYQQGLFEIQDASSQKVSHLLDVKPGMQVIDACAGAGGKSLHLAALMQNRGRIISMDVSKSKLIELKKRAFRNKAHNIRTFCIDHSEAQIPSLYNYADRLLLDVPCSGLGTLRRRPDLKWKFSEFELERIQILQACILRKYAPMLKKGGKMVYSTCSILPSENTKQMAQFVKYFPGFHCLRQEEISPAENAHDGFFMALIEKSA